MIPKNPLFLKSEQLESALNLLFVADLGLNRCIQPVRQGHDVDARHLRILLLAHIHGPTSPNRFKEWLGIPKQTLSNQLKEMAALGLISLQPDDRDQRKQIVTLREPGQVIVQDIHNRQKRLLREAYTRAGPDAVEGFSTVLEALNQLVGDRPGA